MTSEVPAPREFAVALVPLVLVKGRKAPPATSTSSAQPTATVIRLQPRLTEEAKERLATREREPCGPQQLALRFKACLDARSAGELKVLAGALEDLAASAIVWSREVRVQAGIPYRR